MKEFCQQQKAVIAQTETIDTVEKCCHRVDALEQTLRSLRDTCKKTPELAELFKSVTWSFMQPASLTDSKDIQEPSSTCQPATETPSPPPEPQQKSPPKPSQTSPDIAEVMRNMSKLAEKYNKLEALVAALKDRKADISQLTQLRELVNNKGSMDATKNLTDQLNQHRALIDSLMSDREKLDFLRCRMEDLILSLTSQYAVNPKDDSDDRTQGRERSAGRAGTLQDDKNAELVNSLQKEILQLQTECEKLQETTRCLQEDNIQKQSYIEELCKATEELEVKKADRLMVESAIRNDKSALDSKVSRVQFDSVTEQLNALFNELLNKVTGQEQDWHKVVSRLSTEMECKLNRMEFEPVKKELEDRWKTIYGKLQAQEGPDLNNAAAVKKQLVDRFHCLTCDQPVVANFFAPTLVELPSATCTSSRKVIWPFGVNPREKFQPHNRRHFSDMRDYSYLAMSRSCGGRGTIISRTALFGNLKKARDGTAMLRKSLPAQSEQGDIVSYRGHLNEPACITTRPTSSSKEDEARCSPGLLPSSFPETAHGSPLHNAHNGQAGRSGHS
ncbi:glutamine-rich protein 2 isoform X1 [Cheilinus undulatus]|uniref:glutamine-rich protein 2 isoform X1 n=1 Tax=Cheilinus undulatus TaxID=241271 RepID=UPI001BD48898|nr:glutamine-rich protein 2 isoform X1 [Cheilinus undulatus]